MFVGSPPGNYDRLLDFSTAVTGSLFFVPTATFLEDVTADQSGGLSPAPLNPPPPDPLRHDGSLGIGSLKGEPSR
jgi:putative iron-dependent peroxidase